MSEIISHMSSIPEDRWEKAFGKKHIAQDKNVVQIFKTKEKELQILCEKCFDGSESLTLGSFGIKNCSKCGKSINTPFEEYHILWSDKLEPDIQEC